ncbi:hypothetical protein [Desertivirga arenae]|uniref:hypothetical protein n=1 Tax=Desertivirga arenae TaxID=2810309 RepID=UPI001A96F05D|nr:hypothetical protein [Pedobacter sp. SYSU D00823]
MDEIKNLPVYKKAKELLTLAEHIAEYLKENEQRRDLQGQIVGNAMLIVVKISGAEASELYSLKMENAIRIKFAVREMFEAVLFARLLKINHNDYVQLVRNCVEEFRLEFIKWIRTFNSTNDYKDDWGIRFLVDPKDNFEVKMVQTEVRDIDSDDWGGVDWDFDDED